MRDASWRHSSDKCPRKQGGSKGGRKNYAFSGIGQMSEKAVRLQGRPQGLRFRTNAPGSSAAPGELASTALPCGKAYGQGAG